MATEPGQHLADYLLLYADGSVYRQPIRRRFEVHDVVVAWGHLAFCARPHRAVERLDWRGSHRPGEWGRNQTGVGGPEYWVIPGQRPRPEPPGNYWIYALENPRPAERISALGFEASGEGLLAVAACTLVVGGGHPLVHQPLESLLVEPWPPALAPGDVSVDLGVVARVARVPRRSPLESNGASAAHQEGSPYASSPEATAGWGAPARPDGRPSVVVDLAAADGARLSLGTWSTHLADVRRRETVPGPARGSTVRFLPRPERWVTVTVVDAGTGQPTPCRVHFAAADGRYLPPQGHRQEVNDGWFEDYGADLQLGAVPYAYVDGRFAIRLPAGDVFVEVAKGFEHVPIRTRVTIGQGQRELRLTLERAFDTRSEGWVTADTHVHFLSPDTVRLEARAEGVNVVALLVSQWGDLYTNIGDFLGRPAHAEEGDAVVWIGAETRQHLLGHLSLLGLTELPPVVCAGGPEESGLGDPVWTNLAGWAEFARWQGGLVLAPHFPSPLAEVVAHLLLGLVDAVEVRDFAWGADTFAVREWYRLLNCGYRVPAVGGTDKMSAGTPLGGVRTYAAVGPELTFERWADAVRAGRTLTSSGPFIRLLADGQPIGGELRVGSRGATVEVEAEAVAVQPLTALEVVHNGRVVARSEAGPGHRAIGLREALRVKAGWLAARCWGPNTAWHEWPVRVAAHTSPVYLTGARLPRDPADVRYLGAVLDGGLAWLATLATVTGEDQRERLRQVFLEARRCLTR